MYDIKTLKYTSNDIENKRSIIKKELLAKSKSIKKEAISAISSHDIELLFYLYDKIYFDDYFARYFKGKLKFSISCKMTKSAGLTFCPKNIDKIRQEDLIIEIKISRDFFLNFDKIEGQKQVCGIMVDNSLDALMLVFEHELCHVIEFIMYHSSSCKKERFMELAKNIFAHRGRFHSLPTNRQIAAAQGVSIGDRVKFIFDGESLTGIITNINKRATVMVQDKSGDYIDKKGIRYKKYYVPIGRLGGA